MSCALGTRMRSLSCTATLASVFLVASCTMSSLASEEGYQQPEPQQEGDEGDKYEAVGTNPVLSGIKIDL